MRIKDFILFSSLAWASSAVAEPFCVVPVAGGEAKLEVEVRQPYRIAMFPKLIPGFQGLVVQATNRHELYEFDGSSLNLIEGDFPHVWGFAFNAGIHTAPNLDGYGFGSKPRTMFYARNGAIGWLPIEETREYRHAFFDEGAGVAYARFARQTDFLKIENGIVETLADLPQFNGDLTRSIRTEPETGGALALTGKRNYFHRGSSSIWFRPDGGTWSRIVIELSEGERLLETFEGASIYLDGDFVKVFPASAHFEPLVFRKSDMGLQFVGTAPKGNWDYHPHSMTWIGWNGKQVQSTTKTRFGFWPIDVEPTPPKAFVLGPNATKAVELDGLGPRSSRLRDKVFYSPQTTILGGEVPALLHAEKGIVSLDGAMFTEQMTLRYADIGAQPRIRSLGGEHFVQSDKGVFLLNDDLSLVALDGFPVAEPWPHETAIEYVDAWGAFVVSDRRSGKVFVSGNMRDFAEVQGSERISKLVGVQPDPASVLLVGESRLFALTKNCAK